MEPRLCAWCEAPLQSPNPRATTCDRRCRQALFRLRRRTNAEAAAAQAGRFGYADPPFPGLARRYYGREPTYGGEVDHRALVRALVAERYTGWALSTSAAALRDVLPLCPPDVHVCPWVKPRGVPSKAHGRCNAWEAVIVWGGRRRPPGIRDWLRAMPARGGGKLPGRKPPTFCGWLFDLLGMVPGDELDDWFPGSGVVGRTWRSLGGVVGSCSWRQSLGADGDLRR